MEIKEILPLGYQSSENFGSVDKAEKRNKKRNRF
jgi:hypothetical protein